MNFLSHALFLLICCQCYTLPQFIENWPSPIFPTKKTRGPLITEPEFVKPDDIIKDDDDDLVLIPKTTSTTEITETDLTQETTEGNTIPQKYREVAFGWDKYYNLSQIEDWLHSLEEKYEFVEIIPLPEKTYEGREILNVKIDIPVLFKKKVVVIESNLHGNEWLTSSATTYFLNQLLESEEGSILHDLAKNYVWYFIPVANPDGFVFSHSNPNNKYIRNWRKTRTPTKVKNCFGVDAAANFDFKWRTTAKDYSKRKECLGTYSGPYPNSEPCVTALTTFLVDTANTEMLHAYFSFQADGNSLSLPFAHTKDKLDNYEEMYEIADTTVEEIKAKYGIVYEIGSKYNLFCNKNPAYSEECENNKEIPIIMGGSTEYVKAHFNPPIVFQINLRGSRAIRMPINEIVPTGTESTLAIETIFSEYSKLHPEINIEQITQNPLPIEPSSEPNDDCMCEEKLTEGPLTTDISDTKNITTVTEYIITDTEKTELELLSTEIVTTTKPEIDETTKTQTTSNVTQNPLPTEPSSKPNDDYTSEEELTDESLSTDTNDTKNITTVTEHIKTDSEIIELDTSSTEIVTVTKTQTEETTETETRSKSKPTKEKPKSSKKTKINKLPLTDLYQIRIVLGLLRIVLQSVISIFNEIGLKTEAINWIRKLLNQVSDSNQKIQFSLRSVLENIKMFKQFLLEHPEGSRFHDTNDFNEEHLNNEKLI